MANNFTSLSNTPNLMSTLRATQKDLLYNKINCMKVAIVEEFYPETKKVKVNIANKAVTGLNKDGTQILKDYPSIFAKVYYMGWGDRGVTFPITKGMEGFLLFNDREIESWYINGQANPLAYDRCHSISDGVFICGIQSQPHLVEFVLDCINIYYKNTYIRLFENEISINGNTTLTGNLTQTGDITQTGDTIQEGNTTVSGVVTGTSGLADLSVDTAETAKTFTTADGKMVTVSKGIIKSIIKI